MAIHSIDMEREIEVARDLVSMDDWDSKESARAQVSLCTLLDEVERLRAGLETTEPAEEPHFGERFNAAVRCECCCQWIAPGEPSALFTDDDGREIVAHWGRCPEPDLWRIEYVDDSAGEAAPTSEGPMPPEDAHVRLLELQSFWWVCAARLERAHKHAACTAPLDRAIPEGVECTYRKEPCGRAVVSGDRCERHQEVDRG